MHEVIETSAFISAAHDAGMTDTERELAILTVSANPEAGDLMVGTGGCRKVRVAGRGKGKSGGYRLITFYRAKSGEVFLLTVFSKGERANLSKAERNVLADIVKEL
jgi:hypothetical protein